MMTVRTLAVALLSTSCLAASSLDAQACMGLPESPMNLSVGTGFADGVKTAAARVGVNGSMAFAGLSAGVVSYSEIDRTAPTFNGSGGLVLPVGKTATRICPFVSGSFQQGPTVLGIELQQMGGQFGLAIGGVVPVIEGFSVLPFAGAAAVYARTEAKEGTATRIFSETGGGLSVGFGLLFAKTFVVSPTVTVPFGFEDSEATFGIQASVGFGKR